MKSFVAYIGTIKHFFASHSSFHVIAITEFGPDTDGVLARLDGYFIFSSVMIVEPRDSGVGGGVALYVHEPLTAKVLSHSDHVWEGKPGLPEYIFCEVFARGCLFS